MEQTQQAPTARRKHAGAYTQIHHEGKQYWLNASEYRVYSLLMSGGRWATFDLSTELSIPDPRSVVRYLRKMGIRVGDVWVKEQGQHFKRYFIHSAL